MTRYHYIAIPVTDVIDCFQHAEVVPKDAYLADTPETRALRDVVSKGYRWIRSEPNGYAIFEKIVTPQLDRYRSSTPEAEGTPEPHFLQNRNPTPP
jgi:hypothetical protein